MRKKIAIVLIYAIAVLCIIPSVPVLHWFGLQAWMGLVAGLFIALTIGNPDPARSRSLTPKLLAWSVVGLGAAMNLMTVASVGIQGFGYTIVGISVTLLAGIFVGRILGVGKKASILISVGTAVCGGSAIAAASAAINANEEETSVSLATVFVLNAAALLIFPFIGHSLHLGERAFGLWAALGIHDTSSVVGASVAYGEKALVVATTTKLARALWIVPLTIALSIRSSRQGNQDSSRAKPKYPWFILGFLLMAATFTFIPAIRPVGLIVSEIAKRSLVLTLFLLGLGLNRSSIANVGFRPFLQGIILWIVAGGGTLAAVLTGIIR